jgi:hypothetical protein
MLVRRIRKQVCSSRGGNSGDITCEQSEDIQFYLIKDEFNITLAQWKQQAYLDYLLQPFSPNIPEESLAAPLCHL